jgi:hypothetical protein
VSYGVSSTVAVARDICFASLVQAESELRWMSDERVGISRPAFLKQLPQPIELNIELNFLACDITQLLRLLRALKHTPINS